MVLQESAAICSTSQGPADADAQSEKAPYALRGRRGGGRTDDDEQEFVFGVSPTTLWVSDGVLVF